MADNFAFLPPVCLVWRITDEIYRGGTKITLPPSATGAAARRELREWLGPAPRRRGRAQHAGLGDVTVYTTVYTIFCYWSYIVELGPAAEPSDNLALYFFRIQ